jgi:Putative prokaryotic signal transducing protein
LRPCMAAWRNVKLEKIATDLGTLTEIARTTLQSELSRRGITLPPETATHASVGVKRVPSPPPVMIRRYRDLPEATIAKTILDSAGIESFLAEENIVRLDWFYSNLVGGIKLLVRAEDADAARKWIEQEITEKFEVTGQRDYEQPRCPRCGSWEVAIDGLDKRLPMPFCSLAFQSR